MVSCHSAVQDGTARTRTRTIGSIRSCTVATAAANCTAGTWYNLNIIKITGFKTFSRLFSKQKCIFCKLEVIKQMINGDLFKMQKQSYCHGALQTQGQNWIKPLLKHLLFLRLFTIFPDVSTFSRLFPGLDNCWANFKTFSIIQDSVQTLWWDDPM